MPRTRLTDHFAALGISEIEEFGQKLLKILKEKNFSFEDNERAEMGALIKYTKSDQEPPITVKNKSGDQFDMELQYSHGKNPNKFTFYKGSGKKNRNELFSVESFSFQDLLDKINVKLNKAKTASITERLDIIASELEQIDPRIALAIDRISDKLEGR